MSKDVSDPGCVTTRNDRSQLSIWPEKAVTTRKTLCEGLLYNTCDPPAINICSYTVKKTTTTCLYGEKMAAYFNLNKYGLTFFKFTIIGH